MNEYKLTNIKNNCWKSVRDGWVIVVDMDEWLCVTENDLINEKNNQTTLLTIQGRDIVGNSECVNLSDINLQTLNKYVENIYESKNLCFYRPSIKFINYLHGAHFCNPKGKINFSSKVYINKHMCNLGLPFLINKHKNRYNRSELMRSRGIAIHYTDDNTVITENYNSLKSKCLN